MVAGESPVGDLGPPQRIAFQEGVLGASLDDISIVAANGETRWYGSIKTFDLLTGSRLNDDFIATAWSQLLSPAFVPDRDFVGFVSGRAAEGNWQALLTLIETARTDAPDRLAERIAKPGAFDESARSLWASARCPEVLEGALPIAPDASPAFLLSRL